MVPKKDQIYQRAEVTLRVTLERTLKFAIPDYRDPAEQATVERLSLESARQELLDLVTPPWREVTGDVGYVLSKRGRALLHERMFNGLPPIEEPSEDLPEASHGEAIDEPPR